MTTSTSTLPRPLSPLLAAGGGAVLAGVLLSFLGGVWDIQWHSDVGPDTFFTAPHLLLYTGAALTGLSSLAVVLESTQRSRRRGGRDPAFVPILWRTFRAPIGFVVAGTGGALFLLAGLYDQWWHGLYGFDAVLDSPPHVALGLADLVSLAGAVTVFALLARRTRSAWPLVGMGTAAAVFLANSAAWQLSLPVDLAGGLHAPVLFVAALYPLVLATLASVVRRPGIATLTAAAFTLLCAVSWVLSSWATPLYADAIGLYPRDDAPGFPEIIAVLPKLVLPAAVVLDVVLAAARRRGLAVATGVALAGAAAAAVLTVPELAVPMGTVLDPVGRPLVTGALAVAAGAGGAWAGWRLGVVLRVLADPPAGPVPGPPPPGARRGPSMARSLARLLAVVVAAGAGLGAVPAGPAGAAPAVAVVHEEAVRVGPYDVVVGFSEWPISAERSLDIVFRPEGGIEGRAGTVTLVAPSGVEREERLVRHPRMREAWGLDIIALGEQGRWTVRLDLDGPRGPGTGEVTADLLPRPGPPLAVSALPTTTVGLLMLLVLAFAWHRVRPGRRPETATWT